VSAEGSVYLELLKALPAQYPRDPSAPGVHASYLGPRDGFYASVKRFTEPYGKGELVVCSAKGATLGDALARVAKAWLAKGGQHPKLASAVLAYEESRALAEVVPGGGRTE